MRGFENYPAFYDAYCALLERWGLSRWREWLAKGARGRTLEVGCGTGRNLGRFADGLQVIATEPDERMIRAARRRAPKALLVRASAEALPFRTGGFETVVASLVFCTVPDVGRGLAEVRRVLQPGGQLRLVEHVRSVTTWVGRWQDFIQPAWSWLAGGCHPNRNTEDAVERAGFIIEAQGRQTRGTMRRFSARPR